MTGEEEKVAVIGLGYVGLPLAVVLAAHGPVTGYDISARRVEELREGYDRTGEVDAARLTSSPLVLTTHVQDIRDHSIYIVTVPTPVDAHNQPDLTPVLAACDMLGQCLPEGALVVFESTVYPGVTEEICGPAIARGSGGRLRQGVDFHLGYSPERINPGDRRNTVESVTKIVAADTPENTARLVTLYGRINGGRIHAAPTIRVAEAAKVVENAQRDANIAFINEISNIMRRLGVPMGDVLEAMGTKWNALPFKPGLVGGHCISVDPFYLITCAQQAGYQPALLLNSRKVNDEMPVQLAGEMHAALSARRAPGQGGRVLVMGLTFKEDVPDLRNSKVSDLVSTLNRLGHQVTVVDPLADPDEAYAAYDIALAPDGLSAGPYDMVIGAVAHEAYRTLPLSALTALLVKDGVLADIKGMWRAHRTHLPPSLMYWEI